MPNSETKSVTLDYFAIFRELSGRDRETLATTAATMADLYDELRQHHGFALPRQNVRVAVNDRFSSWDRAVAEGDRVAFIAPVAGG